MRYWKRVKDGKTTTVEGYSHNYNVAGAVEISEAEFDAYVASLPIIPTQVRSLAQEIDDLKARIEKLEKRQCA